MTQLAPDALGASISREPEHGRVHRDLIRRSGIAISAAESWVLWHMAAHGPITADALAAKLDLEPARLGAIVEALGRRGYVGPDAQGVPDLTAKGRCALVVLVRAGQEDLARLRRARTGMRRAWADSCRLTRPALATVPGRAGPARRSRPRCAALISA